MATPTDTTADDAADSPVDEEEKIETQDWPRPRTAWYAVSVFAVILMFAFLDRGIMTLLVEPIKRDLLLSDTQMSLLLGFAFVVFYAFIGIPLARLVDRKSRRVIIAVGLTVWSIATALCGVAQNFWQLFLFRVGIGAGESVNGPATYSMIADFFPREKLPRAIAVLNSGFIAGTGLSLVIGAVVIELIADLPSYTVPMIGTIRNWQLVFFAVGLPGALVAVLLMATVPEPKRRGVRVGKGQKSIPLRDVIRYLFRNWRVYGPVFIGLAISSIEATGMGSWRPAFFIRTYGWTAQQVGFVTGITTLAGAPLGLVVGPWLSEKFLKKGYDDANLRVLVISSCLAIPFAVLGPLMPNPWLAVAFSGFSVACAMMGAPTLNAAIQIITPNEMRGQVTALYLFIFSVVGSGIGPTFVAVITDYILQSEALLRYALSISAAIMGPLSAFIIFLGMKPYGRRIAEITAEEAAAGA